MRSLQNESKGYKIFNAFNMVFMTLVILVTVVPYLNVLAKALNDSNDSMLGGLTIYPRVFTLDNFKVLLSDTSLYQASIISVLRVVTQVCVNLLVQFMTAYVLTRKGFFGAKFFNLYFLIPMFITGGLIPQYLLYSKINLLNSFWVYVLPGIFSFYNVMIIKSYMNISIPDSLVEASKIDGANDFTILMKIVLPLCKPILATIALWTAVYSWNDWTTTLMFVQSPPLHTLQYKLMQAIKESERITQLIQSAIQSGQNVEGMMSNIKVTPESLISAQVIVVTVPIILVYPFLQKYFVKGVTLGAVKE